MSRSILSAGVALLVLLPASLSAQPSIRSLEPSSRVVTTAGSVTLHGAASGDSAIQNIYWLNEQGHRGPAQWVVSSGQGGAVTWSADVPVHRGANRITVIAVDSRNRAVSTQFSVHRDAPPGPRVTEIRSGWWMGFPVTYAVIDGWPIVEGDIILGTAAQLAASAPVEPGVQPYGLTNGYVSQLWPLSNGVYQIPYTIQSGAPNLSAAIAYVNNTLSGVIQWVPQTVETNYVTFNFNPGDPSGSCESAVGMLGNQQFIGGSIDCAFATIVHEMGHTIGLLHEHQRPDRNSFVVFTPANVDKPYIAGNFDFFTSNYQVVGLYDYASVMHYYPFAFTKNNLPALESIPAGIPLSNTAGYTPGDIDTIQRLYGLTSSAVTVTTNPAGLPIIVDGTTYTAPKSFTWTLNSTHTLSLPPDPQFTSPGDGSTYMFAKWNDSGAQTHTVANGGGSGLLTSPANKPAITVYEANYIRLQPFASSASPAGAGTVSVSPAPQSLFGGSFFVDRQQITLSASPNAGQNFYGWSGPPYPQGGNSYPFFDPVVTNECARPIHHVSRNRHR